MWYLKCSQKILVSKPMWSLQNLLQLMLRVKPPGFDIDSDSSSTPKEDGTRHTVDAVEKQVFDLLMSKHWALKYATNAASTILRVDQIIMAKRAGGPKPRGGSGPMDQDDDY